MGMEARGRKICNNLFVEHGVELYQAIMLCVDTFIDVQESHVVGLGSAITTTSANY